MRRIVIFGATSAIAEATARQFAGRGDALFLVGRSRDRLGAIAEDLKVRGAIVVETGCSDLRDLSAHESLLEQAWQALDGIDMALIAHGTLSDQAECENSVHMLLQEFHTNALSVMSLCTLLARRYTAQRSGVIAVISSVAGDRGRSSNYVYGSAKAAVTSFTSGLRQRLRSSGVSVVTIKPGFVDTPMTIRFKKGVLWASAGRVGADIAAAMVRGTPVVYTPGFWRPIMWLIRNLPEVIFKRLSF